MTQGREKFLEGLKFRLEEKSPEEQEAEKKLANFVQFAEKFANELENNGKTVNRQNLHDMFVERNYNGKYDVFKLDRDEGMISLAIGVLIKQREEITTDRRELIK